MLFVSFTSIFWAVQSYAVKKTVSTGISRRDFFFYSCLCLLPFAAIMLIFTPVYFTPTIWLIPIFAGSVLLRYGKQTAEAATMEKLVPYESEAYMCLCLFLGNMAALAVGYSLRVYKANRAGAVHFNCLCYKERSTHPEIQRFCRSSPDNRWNLFAGDRVG